MFQAPSQFQGRVLNMKQQPIVWHNWQSGQGVVFLLTLIVATASIVQDASAQETLVSPSSKRTLTDETPAVSIDNQIAVKEESETINLLTDDLTQHWKTFSSSPELPDAPVWKVVREGDDKELILICSGQPKGFLYTTESWAEFELTLEWKYPKDADGNSGVLVYTQEEPRIWPTSMQVQLHQPKAGDVFPSGDAMSDDSGETGLNLARPVDTWNEGKIVSRSGRLSIEVNGKKAGEVSGAKPSSGHISLQSEGSVVHFRRLRLRKLPVTDPEMNSSLEPANNADRSCFQPLSAGSLGSWQWYYSERGGRTSIRRTSKVSVTTTRHRRP